MTDARLVDEADLDAYRRDGAIVVRGALSAREVAAARTAIDSVIADPGPRSIVASAPDDPGRFVEDFCRWNDVAALEALALDSRLPAMAAELMATETVRFFHDHVLVKEPGTTQRTPWHQDQPYYNVSGSQNVSFWIPVDPVEVEACLALVAGSHLGPWLLPRTFLDGHARWFPEGTLAELPDIDADPERFDLLRWGLSPGDAIAFHGLTVHGAPGVAGAERRRVVTLRYLGDDARHAVRVWATSPEFPGLVDELVDGAPLDHPLFPLAYDVRAGTL